MPGAPRLLLLLIALAGCREATQEIRNTIGERLQASLSAADKPDTSSAPLPPELVGTKLSLYLDCVNSTRVPLYAGFRQVNAASAAGKRARLQTIDPVLEEAFEKCVKAQREGPLLQPPLPALETAAGVYLASARELAAAIAAVRAELVEPPVEPRRPIKPAKGKGKQAPPPEPEPEPEPAPRLTPTDPKTRFHAAFTRWDETRRGLDEAIDDLQANVDAAVLATVERKFGKRIEWHTRDLMRAAKPYVRCLGDHDEITAKICEAFFAPLAAARLAFLRVHDADPRGADEVFWMKQFADSLAEFFTSADALRAALRDNTARSADLGRTLHEYNDLVHDYHLLNFSTAS